MSTAVITPLRDGSAVFELNGITHRFPDWRAAADEADVRSLQWHLMPFPTPAVPEPATP